MPYSIPLYRQCQVIIKKNDIYPSNTKNGCCHSTRFNFLRLHRLAPIRDKNAHIGNIIIFEH